MKSLIVICCTVFLFKNFLPAQIVLGPNGGCGITKEGALDCSWSGAIDIRKPSAEEAARERNIAAKSRQYPTSQYNLAPGAPFDAGSANYDRILVAVTDGYLVNEAHPTQDHFALLAGSVLLLCKEKKYLLRNAGDKNLHIVLVLISK